MATNLSPVSASCHHYAETSADRRSFPFAATLLVFTVKRAGVSCSNRKIAASALTQDDSASSSLAEQLKPLSDILLSDQPNQPTFLPSKPKSTWVNPTRPKPSVLSLQRQKRSSFSYNPQIRSLLQFARRLNNCVESDFTELMKETPHPITRDNALLLLNTMRSSHKALLLLNWVKTQNEFPLETIFYNVVMKSLRFDRQFHIVENLALEMIDKGIELDNITYSTIITCAKKCNVFDKAVEWFERMYKTGVMPDEVTYSAVLDVYAKLGKVEEVLRLYERGRASGWKPDPIAFSVLAKVFGEAGDLDGIRFVLKEMKSLNVQPNLVLYNTLLEAMGKAGKTGFARSLFEEMVNSGIDPNEKTLTALIKIYGKARWARDALDLWERMKHNGWPRDLILYNTLLSMCADLGLIQEAERLFEDMKASETNTPDSWSYTAMLNIYGSGKNADKAIALFEEMCEFGIDLNVMGCTCLIQCLGRSKRIDDLEKVFKVFLAAGVKPDDRLSGCLLSVMSYCEGDEDIKVLSCLEQANPKLATFVRGLIDTDHSSNPNLAKQEFKKILSSTSAEARRPFCNCLIDICRNRNQCNVAHELLYLGTLYRLYPGLHTKTQQEWRLNVRSLSIGAAYTAFEEWMMKVGKMIEHDEPVSEMFSASTGAGNHKLSQGLGSAFASHLEKMKAPFKESQEKPGFFIATRQELVSWVQSEDFSAFTSSLL